jgi:diacylglycerol O-acyltransferase / trehalose O-mycolyltransferase
MKPDIQRVLGATPQPSTPIGGPAPAEGAAEAQPASAETVQSGG